MSETSGNPMQLPQIPIGPLTPVGWDPDDHLWRPVSGAPAGVHALEDVNTLTTPVPANTWTDVLQQSTAVPAGTAVVWAKLCVQDTSGAANTIRARIYLGTYPTSYQVFDEAIVSVPSNGYATLAIGPFNEFSNVDWTAKLDVFSTGACTVLAGVAPDQQQALIVALWLSTANV